MIYGRLRMQKEEEAINLIMLFSSNPLPVSKQIAIK